MGRANPRNPRAGPDSGGRPVLVPYLYLDAGKVVLPNSQAFAPVLDDDGKPIDPFDAADRLAGKFHRLCVVDLEGLRRNRPQLDYLQELSRSGELWVDAGVRTADQMIDVLVTGARRAVLSTAYLLGPKELKRAWRLSTEVLFAVETEGAAVRNRGNDWDGQPAPQAVASARGLGVVDVILRTRDALIDWPLVTRLAREGPVWVGGHSGAELETHLASAGAAGGLFDAPRGLLTGSDDGGQTP